MSFANLGAHWWVILIIVVLLFGAPKLPALARSMGQSMRIFKNEIKNGNDEGNADKAPTDGARADSARVDNARVDSARADGDTSAKP